MKDIEIEPVVKKTRRKKKRNLRGENTEKWEELRGRGVLGIDSLPGGGIVSAPISGKSLPRLGRRIAGFLVRPPKTDKDGEGDNFRYNPVTGKDDLPVVSIAGSMKDDDEFVGLDGLKQAQKRQVQHFEGWASAKMWQRFHNEHFDWWTFPIDKGSAATGFKYDVSGAPLEELKTDTPYLQSLARAAKLYALSLGWDSKARAWMSKPDTARGQGFSQNKINKQRLFKIGRSLQIHGLKDDFDSHAAMVNLIRQQHAVGNDSFWDDPDGYVMKSSYSKNKDNGTGISGSMAGSGVSPTVFDAKRNDPRKTPDFIRVWKDRDNKTRRKEKGTNDLTFDWQDENSRLQYRQRIWDGTFDSGDAKGLQQVSKNMMHNKKEKEGLGEVLHDNLKLIAGLGLHWVPATGKGYPRFNNQYGLVFTHSSTPAGAKSEFNQIRDLKGVLNPNLNPESYWNQFEAWIRNPFIVMKDTNTGPEVGVRKYFKNNRVLMLQEFDRRIAEIYKIFNAHVGKDFPENDYKPPKENLDALNPKSGKVPDWVEGEISRAIEKNAASYSDYSTLAGLHKRLKDEMEVLKESAQAFTVEWLEVFLKKEYPQFFKAQIKNYPEYTKPSILDSLPDAVRRDAHDMMAILHSEEILAGRRPINLDLEEARKSTFIESIYQIEGIEDIIQKLHEDELTRNRLGL